MPNPARLRPEVRERRRAHAAATSAFATSLRRVLAEKQLGYSDLADMLSVDKSTVSAWATGSTSPSIGHVVLAARALGVDVGLLAKGEA